MQMIRNCKHKENEAGPLPCSMTSKDINRRWLIMIATKHMPIVL